MIFLSDLDRTLIFSYKKMSEEDLCVEEMDGKKLSYMTRIGAEMFSEMTGCVRFIPITTRSIVQYKRITFPGGYVPEYAVTDNGGNLLINGSPDRLWREWAEDYIDKARDELFRCADFLKGREEVYLDIRLVDDTFLYTKCKEPDKVLALMRESTAPEKTDFFRNGDKIYVIPQGIGKKEALLKLKERFGERIIAAGDSLFDREMLKKADAAIICGELAAQQPPEKINPVFFAETGDDPDFTLKTLLHIIKSEFMGGIQ